MSGFRAIAEYQRQDHRLYDARTAIEQGQGRDGAIAAATLALSNTETRQQLGDVLRTRFSRLYINDRDQTQVSTENKPYRLLKCVGNAIGSFFGFPFGVNPWKGMSDRNRAAHATVIAFHEAKLIEDLEKKLEAKAALPPDIRGKMNMAERQKLKLTPEERTQIREALSAVATARFDQGQRLRSKDAARYAAAAERLSETLTTQVEQRAEELSKVLPLQVNNRVGLETLTPTKLVEVQKTFADEAKLFLGENASAAINSHFTDPAKKSDLMEAWESFKARAVDPTYLRGISDTSIIQVGQHGDGKPAVSADHFHQVFLTQYFGLGPDWMHQAVAADTNSIISALPSADLDPDKVVERRKAIIDELRNEMIEQGRPTKSVLNDITEKFLLSARSLDLNPDDVTWLMSQINPSDGSLPKTLAMTKGGDALKGAATPGAILSEMVAGIEQSVDTATGGWKALSSEINDRFADAMLPAMQLHNKQAIRDRELTNTGGLSTIFAKDLATALNGQPHKKFDAADVDWLTKTLQNPSNTRLEAGGQVCPTQTWWPPALAKTMREAVETALAGKGSFAADQWDEVRGSLLKDCATMITPALEWRHKTQSDARQAAMLKEAKRQAVRNEIIKAAAARAQKESTRQANISQNAADVNVSQISEVGKTKPAANLEKLKSVLQRPADQPVSEFHFATAMLLDDLKPTQAHIEVEFKKYLKDSFKGESGVAPTEAHLSWLKEQLVDVKNFAFNNKHHIHFRPTDSRQTGVALQDAPRAQDVFKRLGDYQIPKYQGAVFGPGKNIMEKIEKAELRSYKFLEAMRREVLQEIDKISVEDPSGDEGNHLDRLRGAALRPLMPLLHAYAEQEKVNSSIEGKNHNVMAQTNARMMR